MKKNKKGKGITLDDYVKAAKRGSREGEQELLGPGFHAAHCIHRSLKTYTRKQKHKGGGWE